MAKNARKKAAESGTRRDVTRRGFLGTVGAGAALTATTVGLSGCGDDDSVSAATGLIGPLSGEERRMTARDLRINAAQSSFMQPIPVHVNNGDEDRYPTKYGSYSKCLQHDALGVPLAGDYDKLLTALSSGSQADFGNLNSSSAKQHSPQAGLAFETEGRDSYAIPMPPAPTFRSAETAGEMVEVYWLALCRDVWFNDYANNPIAGGATGNNTVDGAVADLNGLSDFRGPRLGGVVAPGALFRGLLAGDEVGPYISQFLLTPFNYGSIRIDQKHRAAVQNVNYMTQVGDGTSDFQWLHIQNGGDPPGSAFQQVGLNSGLYIRDLRTLARALRDDPLYQYFYNAALICLQSGVPVQNGNYYKTSTNQLGFATLGPPFLFELIARACGQALRAIWFQKWYVHRRIRPEAYAGRVHFHQAALANYELHQDVLNSSAMSALLTANGTALLPCAYPEGSPPHPAYGAGHAVVAGAGVTILKAFFDTKVTLASLPATAATTLKTPKYASADGLSLIDYVGPDAGSLTVEGELHKLASNDGLGRNAAGVHWRTDLDPALLIGESVAISILQDRKSCLNEPHSYTLTKFDGTTITI